MTTRRLTPLLLLPLAFTACGDDPTGLTAGKPAVPTATAPTEPTEPVVASPTPVATVAPPAASTPARRAVRSSAAPRRTATAAPAPSRPAGRPGPAPRAEVRGDASSMSTGRWTLRVSWANGDVMTGQVQAEPELRPDVLGVVDADRDGDHEVFVRTGGGASTTTYSVFAPVEDGMAEVRDGGGRSMRLVVGGGVMHGDGFRCDRGTLTVLSVVSDDGETFRGTAVTYAWRDDRVTESSRRSFTGRSGDAQVRAAYGIDCAGLSADG